jgi:hypothetical protein
LEADKLAQTLLSDFSAADATANPDTARQHTNAIFGPLLRVLPSASESAERVLRTDKMVLAPFLVSQFASAINKIERNTVFYLIQGSGLGREVLPALEHIVRIGQYPQWDFEAAVKMARLGDSFASWYQGIRGKSEEEEKAAEKERERSSLAERAKREWKNGCLVSNQRRRKR